MEITYRNKCIPKRIKSQEIRRLIKGYQERYCLCCKGKERLQWWFRNGHRFATVQQALLTWTEGQLEAYFTDQGITVCVTAVDSLNARAYANYKTYVQECLVRRTYKGKA